MNKLYLLKENIVHREVFPKLSLLMKKPSLVHISITDRCNLKCKHCDIWKRKAEKEIATEQWISVLKQIRSWAGPFTLKIAGGEPLVRKDIHKLIRYASENNIFTGLSTNGVMIDSKVAQSLVIAGLNEIYVSLESTNQQVHNYLKSNKGAFERTVDGIYWLKKWKEELNSDMRINLACIINKYTLPTIKELVGFVEANGIYTINFQPMYQNFGAEYDCRWFEKSDLWPTDLTQVNDVIDFLIQKRKSIGIVGNSVEQLEAMRVYFKNPLRKASEKCKAGTKDLALDPYGNLLLCFNKEPVGNVLDNSPRTIWKSNAAQKTRRQIASCKRNCNLLNCNFQK